MKLTQEELNNIKQFLKTAGEDTLIDLFDTIETQKQEIEQHTKARVDQQQEADRLHRWISDLQRGIYVNCVYCGHRYGPEDEVPTSMADVLKEHIEHCPEHPMSKLKQEFAQLQEQLKYAEGAMEIEAFDARQLRQDVELLAAQATIMREALKAAYGIIIEFERGLDWHKDKTIAAIEKKMDSCHYKDWDCIRIALSADAGKEYHNPADVEALKQMREGLNKISEEVLFSSFGDEICMVCPWPEKPHLPESLCEGCSCTEALEKWKEEM